MTRTGFMIGWERLDREGYKFMVAADYASGDNAVGGGGRLLLVLCPERQC